MKDHKHTLIGQNSTQKKQLGVCAGPDKKQKMELAWTHAKK